MSIESGAPPQSVDKRFDPFSKKFDDAYNKWIEARHTARVARAKCSLLRVEAEEFFEYTHELEHAHELVAIV